MKHNMVLFSNFTACLQATWSYFNVNFRQFTISYYYRV